MFLFILYSYWSLWPVREELILLYNVVNPTSLLTFLHLIIKSINKVLLSAQNNIPILPTPHGCLACTNYGCFFACLKLVSRVKYKKTAVLKYNAFPRVGPALYAPNPTLPTSHDCHCTGRDWTCTLFDPVQSCVVQWQSLLSPYQTKRHPDISKTKPRLPSICPPTIPPTTEKFKKMLSPY